MLRGKLSEASRFKKLGTGSALRGNPWGSHPNGMNLDHRGIASSAMDRIDFNFENKTNPIISSALDEPIKQKGALYGIMHSSDSGQNC